uniref:Transposase n=1 Tax=Strongyloides stercoralis TaxID=6248 RepID=A0A0K0E6N5_STRER
MASIPSEVEKNVKKAIKNSDLSSTIVSKVKESNPYANVKEIVELTKTVLDEIDNHKFTRHEEIYKSSGVEDKRRILRNESKAFPVKDNTYPSPDSKFLSILCEKLSKDVKNLEKELVSLQK